jgi:hypothetical protein
MLDEFLIWASATKTDLQSFGVKVIITVGEASSNSSARLDVECDRCLGRITVWNGGDIDMEVIEAEDGATIFSRQASFSMPYEFDRWFSDFFGEFGIQGPEFGVKS